jgi:type IV pilus assembly protein PilA
MLLKLRQRMASDQSGFTLVELLVVMLILGLLAAIAIPAFFNQRNKAKDSSAKEMARTAETSMETYATDNNGTYDNATPALLNGIEPTVQIANNNKDPWLSAASGSGNTYTLSVTSQTGNVFTIARGANSIVTFSCTTTGQNGCPTSGDWAH